MASGVSDGALIIDTKLDNSGFMRGARDFKRACETLKNTAVNAYKAMDKAAVSYVQSVSKQGQAARDASRSMADLQKRYSEVLREMNEIQRTGGSASRYEQLSGEAKSLVAQMRELRGARTELGGVEQGFENVAQSAGRARQSIMSMIGGGVWQFLKGIATHAKNAAIQLAKLAGRAIASGMKKLASYAGNAAKSFFHLGKNTRQANGGFKLGLKNVLRYGLGIRSLFVLFNRLRKAIKEGFEQLSKSNPQVQASLTSLKSALNGLKGSLASAFAPILTAIAPALTTLINLLTQAVNAIGMFFAALTGQAFYSVAKGIGAIGSGAKSAGGAAKQLKRELAGFDELNILSDKSGGGGGGSGSGAGFTYSQVPISEGIRNFVDELKRLFEAGEYEAIGRVIADGINKAIQKVQDYIKWDNIGPTITKALEVVTGSINGLFDGIDWENLGATVGEGLNTITNTLLKWYRGIDWYNIGSGIARGMNGLVDRVDWANIGKTIREKAHSLILTLRGAFENFSWGHAGEAFASTVNALFKDPKTWEDAGKAIDAALNGALDFVGKFLGKLDGKQIAIDIKAALGQIRWGDIWSKFKEDARLAFGTVGDFLRELLGGSREYGTSVEDAIAEHLALRNGRTGGNNSTAMLGELIGQGLSTAITGALKLIMDFFDNDIPWDTWGNEIHKMIIKIDWMDVADKLWDAIIAASRGLGRLLIAAIFGSDSKIYKWLFPDKPGARTTKGIVEQILGDTSPVMQKAGTSIAARILNRGGRTAQSASLPSPYQLGQSGYYGGFDSSYYKGKKTGFDFGLDDLSKNIAKTLMNGPSPYIIGLDPNYFGSDKYLRDKFAADGGDLEGWDRLFYDNTKATEKNTKAINNQTKEVQKPSEVKGIHEPTKAPRGQLGNELELRRIFSGGPEGVQKINTEIDFIPAGVKGFINQPLAWLQKMISPGTDMETRTKLVKKIPTQTPATLFEAAKVLGILATLGKKDKNNSPSTLFNVANVLKFLGILNKKDANQTPAKLFSLANILNFLASLNKKDGNQTPGKLFNLATALGFLATLGKKDGNQNAPKLFNVASPLDFLGLLKKKDKNQTPAKVFGDQLTVTAVLVKKAGNKLSYKMQENLKNGTIQIAGTGGKVSRGGFFSAFASGGMISGAHASWWGGIKKYASGTARAHGTLFAAGEAGPEIIGHINGRTEILNKSQLAQTMASAVSAGMIAAMNAITFRMPAMATGAVMPYEIAAQIAQSTDRLERTLDANNEDLIQTIISVAAQIVAAMNSRPVQQSARSVTPQQVIDEINRRTQMFGASPLMGV